MWNISSMGISFSFAFWNLFPWIIVLLLSLLCVVGFLSKYAKRRSRALNRPTISSGYTLHHALSGHKDEVRRIAWSPAGRIVASCSVDGTVRLWDAQTGALHFAFAEYGGAVYDIAWSPKGPFLVAGFADGAVRLWNTQTGRLLHTFFNHRIEVRCINWSPDGQIIASGSADGSIQLWNTQKGTLLHTFSTYPNEIFAVAWSPSKHILASGSANGSIQLWNTQKGTLLHTFSGHTDDVRSIAWSPDGSLLASGSYDGGVRVWDLQKGLLLRTFVGHRDMVKDVAWSPDEQLLASSSTDGTIRLWSTQTGVLKHILCGHKDTVYDVAWSPDGGLLASASADCTVRLWNTQTGVLTHILGRHESDVKCVAWSPDGQMLASGSDGGTVRLWDTQTGTLIHTFTGHRDDISCLAWSPDGGLLASASTDGIIRLWNHRKESFVYTLVGHKGTINVLTWSPHGQSLASGSADGTVRLWNTSTGISRFIFSNHNDEVISMVWSPDGRLLATGSADRTIRLWDIQIGYQTNILEGHTDPIWYLSFSLDGLLLASFSSYARSSTHGTVRIWRSNTWDQIAILENLIAAGPVVFHPTEFQLATPGKLSTEVLIWKLDSSLLLNAPVSLDTIRYINAKVVLLGDSGVGKSGLGHVLTGNPFTVTESTHGRHVWTFASDEIQQADRPMETHEILLWDLAGQPGYRLIHQLHLDEIAVALVVFDAHSDIDPFAGVLYWDRALRQAQNVMGDAALPLKKFLVAARIDRGGIDVSNERMRLVVQQMGFDSFFKTSAKENQNIVELKTAILEAIEWDQLPMVSSTRLFQRIKAFLIVEKEAKRFLSTLDDLYYQFLASKSSYSKMNQLRDQFETCIGRIEAAGLIKRLSFGKLVLLQPELLDAYASALLNAVREEPDGLGSIAEESVRLGDFRMPIDERLKDKEQEKLLLIAMIEDLLRREIVLREGPFLVFPSQSTREMPDIPDPEGKSIIFTFEGSVPNIFATLAVRLSNSDLFRKKDLWQNAVSYIARAGGTCGIVLRPIGEGQGELTLFFDEATSEQTRFHFDEYIQAHLERLAIPGSIHRRRLFVCSTCKQTFADDSLVRRRRERGFDWMPCGVCETKNSLLDREELLPTKTSASRLIEMDYAADHQRERSAATSILQGKIATKDFDVFLCHHPVDKPAVKQIGEQLKERGILPWLDEWELPPGRPWQRILEQQIAQIQAAAVFVGQNGTGPWEDLEIEALLRQFVKRDCPIIPVILADAGGTPQLPMMLGGMTWVDFRIQKPEPLTRLIWGITGKKYI